MSRRGRTGSALRACLAAVLAGLALAACGDSDESGDDGATSIATQARPHILSAADVKIIDRARERVGSYCGKVSRSLSGEPGPSPADSERVNDALDELAELGARDPAGQAPDGSTARLALGDIAEDLEGSNCDPRLVARIDEALASLPAQ